MRNRFRRGKTARYHSRNLLGFHDRRFRCLGFASLACVSIIYILADRSSRRMQDNCTSDFLADPLHNRAADITDSIFFRNTVLHHFNLDVLGQGTIQIVGTLLPGMLSHSSALNWGFFFSLPRLCLVKDEADLPKEFLCGSLRRAAEGLVLQKAHLPHDEIQLLAQLCILRNHSIIFRTGDSGFYFRLCGSCVHNHIVFHVLIITQKPPKKTELSAVL